ncbi:Voltage-dependent calcium channel subunit alpha-2/delta-3-like protein [Leptotrombidium deliense]|uniref:Voltage-dependent calcium channel subunit alpha-2/delta-3-like protein n=1 Tax=Leptotrombidium deliense TaxID=299467 RepID=A0A443SM72_9ACAR|nr:Voltage-dependent calcium channel subunit alpha-2/delta-3-like protein [Leptotrombidium deliense]
MNTYYHGPIKDSPFVLGISLPDPYGTCRISGQIEVKIGGTNHSHYFEGDNWRVHPDWVYCNDDSQNFVYGVTYKTPEEGILLILDKLSKASNSIRWKASSLNPQKSQGRSLICK